MVKTKSAALVYCLHGQCFVNPLLALADVFIGSKESVQ